MHYLKLALLAEGPSDHRFLPLVLRRLTIDLCARNALRPVEIDDEVMVLSPRSFSETDWSFNVLFSHADGAGNPAAARTRSLLPLADWRPTRPWRPVPVIPVREMEAWALVDGEALRRRLRQVPAFQELEGDFQQALEDLGYFR